jgi:hypothetical protein
VVLGSGSLPGDAEARRTPPVARAQSVASVSDIHGLADVGKLCREFNRSSENLRVLAVLSPTCPDCIAGYELVSQMPAGPTRMVLWTAMREGDSADVAARLIGSDRRCSHYWETEGWPVSSRLRPVLGLGPYDPELSVWDVYLLYRPGINWTGGDPPVPSDWTHNLHEDAPRRPRISSTLLTSWSSKF